MSAAKAAAFENLPIIAPPAASRAKLDAEADAASRIRLP